MTMVRPGADQVKELREATGAGILACREALSEAGGDLDRAKDILRKKGLDVARKKSGRVTSQGQVISYIHHGGKVGVLVELNCETDFVARNSDFQQFGRDLAMQVAARNPRFVSRDGAGADWLAKEREIIEAQLAGDRKPAEIRKRIVDGKLEKRFEEVCLLDQKFIKDEDKTIQNLLTDLIAKIGENIVVRRFCRFEVGSE